MDHHAHRRSVVSNLKFGYLRGLCHERRPWHRCPTRALRRRRTPGRYALRPPGPLRPQWAGVQRSSERHRYRPPRRHAVARTALQPHSHQIERAKGECKSWTRVQNTDAVRNIANNRVEKYVNRDPVMLLIRSYQTQFLQFDMTRYTGSTRG